MTGSDGARPKLKHKIFINCYTHNTENGQGGIPHYPASSFWLQISQLLQKTGKYSLEYT